MKQDASAQLFNVIAVARREFVARTGTRTFLVSTLFLVVAAAVIGLVPVVVDYFGGSGARVAVYVGAADLRGDPVATLDALLNPPKESSDGTDPKAFTVLHSTNLDADRGSVLDGRLTALLDVERNADGDAVFTVYTKEPPSGRTAVIARQAATSIALADRLGRAGVSAAEQASLFAAPQVVVRSPDLSKPAQSSQAFQQEIVDVAVIFGLELFLFMAIILYGTWVTQSVVEEKSSRMMEIILAAASPFQLLAGKVIGVSAAAMLQFAAVLVTAVAALLLEGRVASAVLGDSAVTRLPSGLTPALVVSFAVLFVLGFVLYAVLFAAAGSLISRQEDVSQIVMPMTLVSCAGYMIAMYASTGLLDANAGWILALSWVPFLSPYMMLTRLNAGSVGPLEIGVTAVLLAVTIVGAASVASRIYSAGVLMYGQKPSVRVLWKALREAR